MDCEAIGAVPGREILRSQEKIHKMFFVSSIIETNETSPTSDCFLVNWLVGRLVGLSQCPNRERRYTSMSEHLSIYSETLNYDY